MEVNRNHCAEVFHFFCHFQSSLPLSASKQYWNKGEKAIDKNNQQFFNFEAN